MTHSRDDDSPDPENSLLLQLVLKFGAAVGLSSVIFCSGLFMMGQRLMEQSLREQQRGIGLLGQFPFLLAVSLVAGIGMFIAYSPWDDDDGDE